MPLVVYYYFVVSLFLVGALGALAHQRKVSITPRLVAKLGAAFPHSGDDLPKLALLRIVLGAILLIRALALLDHLAVADFGDRNLVAFAGTNVLTGAMLLIGVLVQYVFAFLIFLQWQLGDAILGTNTLGNDVAAILALLLALTNSGRLLSFDAAILKRFPNPAVRTLLLYFPELPSRSTILLAKFSALTCYWLVCLYSLSMHLNEPSWASGVAGPLLLTSNFMSRFHVEFTSLFASSDYAVFLGRISLWLMMFWYATVVPFVLLGGYFRLYVIAWGLLFFCLSLFVLRLGWLGEIELVLWAAMFLPASRKNFKRSFEVAFDDKCNLCDKTVRIIRGLDVFERVRLRPLSSNQDWLEHHGISSEASLIDLHAYDTRSHRICFGYDFYVQLTRRLVLLWPLYPLLIAGRWTRIGPLAYRWVASRRRKLFGTCELPWPREDHRALLTVHRDRVQRWIAAVVLGHIALLGAFYLLSVPAPNLGHAGLRTGLADAAHLYGITPINVFNRTDLMMSENWFTLAYIDHGSESLVPLLDESGARLSYHASDRIYFGHTLLFRRAHIGQAGCFLYLESKRLQYLASVYLTKMRMEKGSYRFVYRQYHQPLPDEKLIAANHFIIAPKKLRCEAEFEMRFRD